MTGQLPVGIAQILIKHIPVLGATSHDNMTAIPPVLHPHTGSSLALRNQQDPILILGHIARSTPHGFPFPVLLFALDPQLFEHVLEVLREGYLIGGVLVHRSQPTGGPPGGEIRELCLGMGGWRWRAEVEVEGRLEDRSCHPSQRRRTDLAEAHLAGRG